MPGPSRESPSLNPDFRDMLSALSAEGAEYLQIPVLSRAHLIRNKKATGRPQDIADAARLESSEPA